MNKTYIELHKKVKPQTKEHSKMCKEEEKLFKEWFAIKKSTSKV